MPDRIGQSFMHFVTQLATAGFALSMLLAFPGTGWPQAAQPSLGVQSPAQQGVPQGPAPQQIEPPAQQAPAAEPENPGLINEIGKLFEKSKSLLPPLKSPGEAIDDFNARAKDAGESLSNLARPSLMVTGRAACTVASNRLQGRRRQALPEQGLQGRQEPRHRRRREMLGESVPAGP